MSKAQSISLNHFTQAVQSAVKSAVQKHPKFKIESPQGITFSYLIRGIPVPDTILANVTLAETQAFANEVAATVGRESGIAELSSAQGAVFSAGHHVIIGIPAVDQLLIKE